MGRCSRGQHFYLAGNAGRPDPFQTNTKVQEVDFEEPNSPCGHALFIFLHGDDLAWEVLSLQWNVYSWRLLPLDKQIKACRRHVVFAEIHLHHRPLGHIKTLLLVGNLGKSDPEFLNTVGVVRLCLDVHLLALKNG